MFSLGNGNGTFQATQYVGVAEIPLAVAAVDVNRDGKLDLVTANSTGISVVLGNGDGTFQPPQTFGSLSGYAALAMSDFDGDGFSDLAAMDGSTLSIFTNDRIW